MKKYLLIIIVLLQACSADESLKVPSGFGIRFDVNREFSKDDRLYFLDGEMLISRLKLEGDRVQAEDYFFQNGYQPPLKVSLDADFNSELSFDLPQGIYSRIELDFEIPSANIPVLTINGRFKDSTDTWLPLRIEVSSFEYFQILATDYRGEQEIVIEDQRSYWAIVSLNPVHWFSGISLEQLNQAQQSIIDGEMGILISVDSNSDIYDEVDKRLDELNSLIIE